MPAPADPWHFDQEGEEHASVKKEDDPGQEQGLQLPAEYPAGDHEPNEAEYDPTRPDVNGLLAGQSPYSAAAEQDNHHQGRKGQLFKENQR